MPIQAADCAISFRGAHLNLPMRKTTKPPIAAGQPSAGFPAKPITMPMMIRTRPAASHFRPVRVTRIGRVITSGTTEIRAPQPGHAVALSEISLLHAEHLIRAMWGSYAPALSLARSNLSASAVAHCARYRTGPRNAGVRNHRASAAWRGILRRCCGASTQRAGALNTAGPRASCPKRWASSERVHESGS